MSRSKKLFFVGVIALFIVGGKSFAQVTFSPYSSIGIGDIQDPNTAAKFGMGGLGISNGTYYSLNIVNPALLYKNQVALFSAALLAESKNISQDGFETYKVGSGQLNHMAVAFPLISGKLSTSLVLSPYSAVNYNVTYQAPIDGHPTDSVSYVTKGDGGIDQLALSIGGELFKGFSVGVRASYLFSSVRKESASYIPFDGSNYYVVTYNERLSFQDFLFGVGLAYSQQVGESAVNFGLTYDLKTDLSSKYFARIDQENATGSTIFGDTLANDISVIQKIPSKLGLGISYKYKNMWVAGIDYTTQDWEISKDPVSGNSLYKKREKFVVGGEITPDVASVNNYLKRITYRVGASYTKTPYFVQETQITDFGINFGLSVPVVRFSSLDFGFQFGNRGTLSNNLIKENYFRVYFGVSFNDNRWFLRPKFN
ncbi:MAG: hypothetical protein KDC79_01610 [Cyclobacteriaceae bacterium]|nr:hypothetical protein [Cyclobacteriaceae bacterium]